MENMIYIGKCPICNKYEMLETVMNESSNSLYIMCDECSAEWDNPEDALKDIRGHRETYPDSKVRSATVDEVTKESWNKYIIIP